MVARTLYMEKLRLEWELIFEEGRITDDSLNAFASRILDGVKALGIC